jgi:hypothetical protein
MTTNISVQAAISHPCTTRRGEDSLDSEFIGRSGEWGWYCGLVSSQQIPSPAIAEASLFEQAHEFDHAFMAERRT